MLVRELRRLFLFLAPLLLFIYIAFRFIHGRPIVSSDQIRPWMKLSFPSSNEFVEEGSVTQNNSRFDDWSEAASGDDKAHDEDDIVGQLFAFDASDTHIKIFSISTPDKKYFRLRFGDKVSTNPNIIPHPLLDDTWIIVGQEQDPTDTAHTHPVELACNAAFDETNSELRCVSAPLPLDIASTGTGKCYGGLEYFSLGLGRHDARVFYGPRTPFVVYGSNSQETCFGQWIQDFRALMKWGSRYEVKEKTDVDAPGHGPGRDQWPERKSYFPVGSELRRPPPYSPVEKNWFVFWDPDGQMYAHYVVSPRRVFAKLMDDGSAGSDMGPLTAAADKLCMDKHMPTPKPKPAPGLELEYESVQQATNSLSITLCRRAEPDCTPTDANTFLLTVIHRKTSRGQRSTYEPYVMAFQRRPPFQVYGISRRPLWIHGRERERDGDGRGQILYVTSMSWKVRGRKYHGYLDDVLFLGFGVEDRESAGIDVLAGDLLAGLGLCAEVEETVAVARTA
ncbi:hypothetical protein GGR54DRAFT_579016 [Hypoxylon sp. NC1633]|nr:hypothetical protein GGR54DRAFT_579016 [Hypoxylon sp. NC1633]